MAKVAEKEITSHEVRQIMMDVQEKYGRSQADPLGNITFDVDEITAHLNSLKRCYTHNKKSITKAIIDYLRGKAFVVALKQNDARRKNLFLNTRGVPHELSFYYDARETLAKWPSEIERLRNSGVDECSLVTDATLAFRPEKAGAVIGYIRLTMIRLVYDQLLRLGLPIRHETDDELDGAIPTEASPTDLDINAEAETKTKRKKYGSKRVPANMLVNLEEALKLTDEDEENHEYNQLLEYVSKNGSVFWKTVITEDKEIRKEQVKENILGVANIIAREDIKEAPACRAYATATGQNYQTIYSQFKRLSDRLINPLKYRDDLIRKLQKKYGINY